MRHFDQFFNIVPLLAMLEKFVARRPSEGQSSKLSIRFGVTYVMIARSVPGIIII